MPEFILKRRVAFGDCDPARVAYAGRLIESALDAVDAFWDDLLDGKGWFHMNIHRGLGMPFVRMECEFINPISAGTMMRWLVQPESIGTTSIVIFVEGRKEGQACFQARLVSVFSKLDKMEKINIPEDIREVITRRFPELKE
ncbi:thioesterase family protein [Paracoccus sp. MKU1]|uniref:acyl-CoA thioesterase n=1 Tax=Paracoccus sp. MKU1 TaxID=1745182 RepID=UPI00128F56A3|nr:thioesterase family protein [Paracoccus sp. MKU1]